MSPRITVDDDGDIIIGADEYADDMVRVYASPPLDGLTIYAYESAGYDATDVDAILRSAVEAPALPEGMTVERLRDYADRLAGALLPGRAEELRRWAAALDASPGDTAEEPPQGWVEVEVSCPSCEEGDCGTCLGEDGCVFCRSRRRAGGDGITLQALRDRICPAAMGALRALAATGSGPAPEPSHEAISAALKAFDREAARYTDVGWRTPAMKAALIAGRAAGSGTPDWPLGVPDVGTTVEIKRSVLAALPSYWPTAVAVVEEVKPPTPPPPPRPDQWMIRVRAEGREGWFSAADLVPPSALGVPGDRPEDAT